MSIGNLKDNGNKGNNFPYQLGSLQLLGSIAAAVAPPGGLATEATLVQVLAAIQNGQEFEQLLVMDLGGVGCPAACPTYIQIRIWNTVTHTFDPPIYYNAAGAVVVPVGPLQIVNPQYVLENMLLQLIAINADLDVALSTRASEATLLATNVILTAISGRLDVNLSTRATEATLLLVNTALGTLNVTAATQAKEATQLLVLAQLVAINADLDVALSTRASEVTLAAALVQLTAINADLDVALSTRASEVTLAALNTKFTAVVRTPTLTRAIAAGSVAAGAKSVSVYNAGTTAGIWLGASIQPGEQFSYDAGDQGDTLAAFAYTASATAILVITTVV